MHQMANNTIVDFLASSSNDAVKKLIDDLTKKYPSNENFVFKSCHIYWIVILKKLDKTVTNESRTNVVNPMCAKFRANILLVVDIVNKITGENTNQIKNSVYKEKKVLYKKGEVIEDTEFCQDFENVCAPGIHYFKSVEPAIYYESGDVKLWHDSGVLASCVTNHHTSYNIEIWHSNGILACKYSTDEFRQPHETMKLYDRDGGLTEVFTYFHGILDGQYLRYDKNGKLCESYSYIKGRKTFANIPKWYG